MSCSEVDSPHSTRNLGRESEQMASRSSHHSRDAFTAVMHSTLGQRGRGLPTVSREVRC